MRTLISILFLFLLAISISGQSNSSNIQSAGPLPGAGSSGPTDSNKPIRVSVVKDDNQSQGFNPWWKDLIDSVAKIGTLASVIIAGILALIQIRRNREVRQNEIDARDRAVEQRKDELEWRKTELRWKKAELAREILTNFKENQRYCDALIMLDYSGREFTISEGCREQVEWHELPNALQPWHEPITFTDKEIYIRDCFDQLFDAFNLLEHYLRTDLLEFSDIEFPMAYYVQKLRERRDAVTPFIHHYHFTLAIDFINRFPPSRPAQTKT
jgi:hypothetical protein